MKEIKKPRMLLQKANSKLICLLTAAFLIIYYLTDTPKTSIIYNNRILKSIIWIVICLLFFYIPRVRSKAKLSKHSLFHWWAFNFVLIYIAAFVVGGIFDGFGRSPYDLSSKGILLNLFYIVPLIIAKEFIRNYFINTFLKKESYTIFIVISFFMTIISFPMNRFLVINDYKGLMIFLAQYFAPEFSKNLLVTYMVFYAGALPGIIYLGLLQIFHWLSPILPNLKWITTAFIGILCPAFCLMGIQSMYLKEVKVLKHQNSKEDGFLGWILTSLISILIIWFSVGVFPIYPSVIATGSMEPMIKPGDIILVKKVNDINTIQTNDVIQFRRDRILISHRIIEILEDEKSGKQYRTKGDNNSVPDTELVEPAYIKGEIIYVVPKLGWPSLLIKSKDVISPEEVEF